MCMNSSYSASIQCQLLIFVVIMMFFVGDFVADPLDVHQFALAALILLAFLIVVMIRMGYLWAISKVGIKIATVHFGFICVVGFGTAGTAVVAAMVDDAPDEVFVNGLYPGVALFLYMTVFGFYWMFPAVSDGELTGAAVAPRAAGGGGGGTKLERKRESSERPEDDDDDGEEGDVDDQAEVETKKPTWFGRNIHIISAVIVLVSVLVIETRLLQNYSTFLGDTSVTLEARLSVIFAFAFPIVIFTFLFGANQGNPDNLFMVMPYLLIVFPSAVTLFWYVKIQEDADMASLGFAMVFAGPILTISMILLASLRTKSLLKYYKALILVWIFILIPALFLVPYSSVDKYGNYLLIIGILMMIVGLSLCIVVMVMYSLAIFWSFRKALIEHLAKIDFKSTGVIISVTCLAVCEFMLFYAYYDTETRATMDPMILIIAIVIAVYFGCAALALRLKIHPTKASDVEKMLSLSTDEEIAEAIILLKSHNTVYQKIAFGVALIMPLVVGLPLYFLLGNQSDSTSTVLLGLIIAIPVLSLTFILLLEIKKLVTNYGNSDMSLFLSACWMFVLLPFLAVVPVAISYTSEGDDEGLQQVISTTIAFTCILCMTGVSLGSIALNQLFKRMESERIAKRISELIRVSLYRKGVRTDNPTIRQIYELFQHRGLERCKRKLLAVFHLWDVAEDDPDLNVSKDLIDHLTFKRLSRKNDEKQRGVTLAELKKEKQKEKQRDKLRKKKERRSKYLQCIDSCFPAKIDLEDKPDEDAEKPADEIQKVDDIVIEEEEESEEDSILSVELEDLEKVKVGAFRAYAYNPDKKNVVRQGIAKQQILGSVEYNNVFRNPFYNIIQVDRRMRTTFLEFTFLYFATKKVKVQNTEIRATLSMDDVINFLNVSGISYQYEMDISDMCDTYSSICYSELTGKESPMDYDMFNLMLDKIVTTQEATIGMFNIRNVTDLISNIIYPNMTTFLPEINLEKEISEEVKTSRGAAVLARRTLSSASDEEIMDENPLTESNLNNDPIIVTEDSALVQGKTKEVKPKKPGCCTKLKASISRCIKKIARAFRVCLFKIGKCLRGCVESITASSDSRTDDLNELLDDPEGGAVPVPGSSRVTRKEAPPMEDIVEHIGRLLEKSDNILQSKESLTTFKVHLNLSNAIIIFSKVTEYYTLCSLAFRPNVGWSFIADSQAASTASTIPFVELPEDTNSYLPTLWTCMGFCIMYLCLAIPATRYAQIGTLGMSEDGKNAKFPSKQFFLSKGVGVLGGACYMPIMKNLMDVLSCDFTASPWSLYRSAEVNCFGNDAPYYIYVAGAMICIVIYYPLATFMFPNLQFMDRTADIKFDPSYMVFLSQGKLIITGLAVFFPTSKNVAASLGISLFVLLGVTFVTLWMKPCLISRMNVWNSVSYLSATFFLLGAFVFVITGNEQTGLMVIAGSFVVCLLVAFILLYLEKKASVDHEDSDDILKRFTTQKTMTKRASHNKLENEEDGKDDSSSLGEEKGLVMGQSETKDLPKSEFSKKQSMYLKNVDDDDDIFVNNNAEEKTLDLTKNDSRVAEETSPRRS